MTFPVHPTIDQTKAIVAILGDVGLAGDFLCSLGLTYYQACQALDRADDVFPADLDHRPFLPSGTRQGSTQAGTIEG